MLGSSACRALGRANTALRHCRQCFSSSGEPRYASLSSRKLLRVAGADTVKVLQNLLTNDVRHLSATSPCIYSAILNPLGRVMYDVLVYLPASQMDSKDEPPTELILELDGSAVAPISAHIKKYKFRSKAAVSEANDLRVGAILGGDAQTLCEELSKRALSVAVDPRQKQMGIRILAEEANEPVHLVGMGEEQYASHRYAIGVPEGPLDITPNEAFPLESNFDYLNGVNFDKGCYLGQELTARARFVGATRKRLMPLEISPPLTAANMPESGSPIVKEGKSIGKFKNGIDGRGMALLRLDSVTKGRGETLALEGKNGEPLLVRTFVPDWWPEETGHR